MLYLFLGASCTGKSTVAKELQNILGADVVTGKDYLRLAKNEQVAWKLFEETLVKASEADADHPLVYVVSDKNILGKLDAITNAKRVKFTAELETMKARFAKRTGGMVPAPVEAMLKRQLADWENVPSDFIADTSIGSDPKALAEEIIKG